MLDKETYEKTCKIGQGIDCCRYLVAGGNGLECAKLTSMKKIIDNRVDTGQFTAQGDNCDGIDHLTQNN